MRSWRQAGHDFWDRLAIRCESCGAIHRRSPWRRFRRSHGVRMGDFWYCRAECLELALAEILRQEHLQVRREAAPSHRIPLGLLLLSRQRLTADQLRTALETQRHAGQGKIGEWLQRLGFATEPEITAALARQWSCPVLRKNLEDSPALRNGTLIPTLLLESFRMIPVELSPATGTLLLAFSEGVDRGMLYAVEQMLGCRTEACFVGPSAMCRALDNLAQHRAAGDVIFDRMEDTGECARVIASYATKVSADNVRFVRCGRHLWIRLERAANPAVNLVLRSPEIAISAPASFPLTLTTAR